MTARPPDQDVRDAVRTDLGETFFLEAGAGSGKTSCLVDRFVALVEAGVRADEIAAITFTEAAAAELSDRVRQELQKKSATSEACRAALDVLDRAAICTLHSFAQRILVAHPIEAGIPPRIEVLDEITSEVAFQARWDVFVDELLDDIAYERPIRLIAANDDVLRPLRELALAFADNWDLVDAMQPASVDIPVFEADLVVWCAKADELIALGDFCRDATDTMVKRIAEFATFVTRVRNAGDEDEMFRLITREAPKFSTAGNQTKWAAHRDALMRARDLVGELGAEAERIRSEVSQACVCALANVVAHFTVTRARERQADGRLEFHDLLVLARDVLRHPVHGVEVRRALGDRYKRLLLDEFQDTDPIQLELAVLIGSDDRDAGSKEWHDITVEPGRLFFVGDPKQSIYRFRRADIATFLKARSSLVDAPRQLTTNFRTGPQIVEWVNRTFGTLIREEHESQPAYVALEQWRPAPPTGPSVVFVGDEHGDKPLAGVLRDREAADVADAVRRAVEEQWSVGDGRLPSGEERWRPVEWRDICILLPARTSLPALERALEAAGVPYRAETSSLVYGTREVRDLLAVARAVDDPTDQLSLVTALRSPAFGCGDDDLYSWKILHKGSWDHQRPAPVGVPAEHPVARAMQWLSGMHRERAWLSASQVLDRIIRERRLMQIAFASTRPRDLLRRLRFVLDQARAWQESGGGSLRDYLTWVERQSMESSRVVETVLPETDDQSVRIMTVHGAKGLEFPVTVLSGMTTAMRGRSWGVEVHFPRDAKNWAVKLNSRAFTKDFVANQPLDEQLDAHERLRLLYVAATRARDHLVVSVHRKPTNGSPTAARLFWDNGMHDDLVTVLERRDDAAQPGVGDGAQATALAEAVEPLPPKDDWLRAREAALTVGRRRISVSATRIAEEAAALMPAAMVDPGLAKDPRDLDLPPWQKGRYGTAIGRAVHGALQVVDLATGDGLAAAVAAQAASEGVIGHEATIEALCRVALASRTVKAAASSAFWREVYVGVPVDDVILEGYIDLVYRSDKGLVVVDYKTDAWRSKAELDAKIARYQPQLSAYAHALEQVVGEPIAELVLLFLANGGEERPVERVSVAPLAGV